MPTHVWSLDPAPGPSSTVLSRVRTAVPCPADFRSGPASTAAYATLPDRLHDVPICRPRGGLSGCGSYPVTVQPVPHPAAASLLPHTSWGTFQQHHLDPTPRPWTFPDALDNPRSPWLQALKRIYANPVSFPASISPEGGMLLHSIVRNARPRVVVETGTFVGVSAMWIAAALAETGDGGVLHCFDDFVPIRPGPWRTVGMETGVIEFVARNISDAGLEDHVVLHPGSTAHELRAARDELAAAGGVQLAYLDADHRPMGVTQDFWGVEPLIPTGGLVILHDTFPSICGDEGPRFLLDNVNGVAEGMWQPLDLYLAPINYGLGLMRRVG